jgi:hypothetical protein
MDQFPTSMPEHDGRMSVIKAKQEMQRAAASFAMFLAGVYVIVLFALGVSQAKGNGLAIFAWPIVLVPGAAFIYSLIDAVKVYRTNDAAEAARLWPRSLLFAAIGTALLVAAAFIVNRMTTV